MAAPLVPVLHRPDTPRAMLVALASPALSAAVLAAFPALDLDDPSLTPLVRDFADRWLHFALDA